MITRFKRFFFPSFSLSPPCPPTPQSVTSSILIFFLIRNNPGPWRQDLLASLWYLSWPCGLDTSWHPWTFFFSRVAPHCPSLGWSCVRGRGNLTSHLRPSTGHTCLLVTVLDPVGVWSPSERHAQRPGHCCIVRPAMMQDVRRAVEVPGCWLLAACTRAKTLWRSAVPMVPFCLARWRTARARPPAAGGAGDHRHGSIP